MERNEMIQVLIEKTKVSYNEAEESLEKCNWDLLDAVIYLEKKRKVENNVTIIEVEQSEEEQSKKNKKSKKESGGIGEVISRIFKFIGKIISKGNKSYLEIRKDNEKPIKVSLTISAVLTILAFWPVLILVVVGLFFGYKYSITGTDINSNGLNDILEKVSESAHNIKDDFKDGYKKSN